MEEKVGIEQTDWYQITLDVDVNRKNMNLVVARQILRVHGEGAHLYALEQLLRREGDIEHQRDWRQVLDIIDEINKGESKC